MTRWPIVALGDVFNVARGGSPRPIDAFLTDDPEGVNWIMIGDASGDSKYISATKKRIRREGVSRSRSVTHGDLLLTNSMSFGRPYILNTSGCIHDGWLVLSPRRDGIDPHFFYYLLGSGALYEQFARLAAGAVVKNLNIDLVKGVQVSLPPFAEQRRIADILDKADAIRRKRKEAIAFTEELLRSAFLEMFGDPVTNPKGWEVRPLGGLVADGDSINYGVVQPGSEVANGVPLIRVGDFDGMTINVDGLKRISRDIEANYARSRLRGDEVLVACVGSIGKVALVDGRLAGANIARAVARIRPGKLLIREYLAYFLETPFVQRHFSVETRTVSQPTLNIKQIQETPVLVPPLKEQDAFIKLERRLRVVGTQQRAALVCTDTLFDTLVHRAFRGEFTSIEKPC
jgi:type I restriction enzyme S subunit